jgi:hypothetical protein
MVVPTPVQLIAVLVLAIVVAIIINAARSRAYPNMVLLPPLRWDAGELALKLDDELILALSPSDALRACVYAIGILGWEIVDREANHVAVRRGSGLTRNRSTIEVLIVEQAAGQTSVTLKGSIEGIGPIQKGHLKAMMEELHNAVEREARGAPWLTATGT